MCGISGFVDFTSKSDKHILDEMGSTQHHRGPDSEGSEIFNWNEAVIGLAQNRLAIIDLSPGGHQPMHYNELSIVFNGEIYNYKEVKQSLKELGHQFISGSDTEVILHAYKEWGQKCLDRFIGMFAFVILDRDKGEITIARDRAGVKPLFYYWKNGLFLFASELKAFHKHSSFEKEIDEKAIHQYIELGFVPAPFCIFKNCAKLNPGHLLILSLTNKTIQLKKYWDVVDFYRLPKLTTPYNEALKRVEQLLKSACEYRMVADVPVGVFLSGGYDSATVAALLQSRNTTRIKTFTIGFAEGPNEAPFAADIARHLGTDHTEYYCTTKEALEIIPTLPFFYDEPFADSSAIPTILVSKIARKKVTVALSADGGDEIFAGYNYYGDFLKNLNMLNRIPVILRKPIGFLSRLLGSVATGYALRNKLGVVADVFKKPPQNLAKELHHRYHKINKQITKKLFVNKSLTSESGFDYDFSNVSTSLSIAQAADYKMYLQNDILTKVDRATMSVSLEGREPLLDHRLVEYLAQLPDDYKYGTSKKRILKDILYQYVPRELMDRPKTGFSVPIDSWLKNELRTLLDEHLDEDITKLIGIFDPKYVKQLKQDFIAGKLHDTSIIWRLLQFQMWYNKWMM